MIFPFKNKLLFYYHSSIINDRDMEGLHQPSHKDLQNERTGKQI